MYRILTVDYFRPIKLDSDNVSIYQWPNNKTVRRAQLLKLYLIGIELHEVFYDRKRLKSMQITCIFTCQS